MGTEVTTDDSVGVAGLGVMLFRGYVFGLPDSGDCWDVLEDFLSS